jgi:TRAP-type transport system small permease protein
VIDSLYQWTLKISRGIVCVLFIAMVLIVFFNVIGRYYLNTSLDWSEEVARFMLVWLVFLGSVLAYEKDEHLGLDILVKKLPPRAAALVGILADLLIMFAIGLLIFGGYRMAVDSWDWWSIAVPIPLGVIYVIVPLCGGIMMLQTLAKLCGHIRALRGPQGG